MEVPITDKWQKTFILNPDGTYTLRCGLKAADIEIGAVEIKDAISELRATLENRGGKGAITVQIVDDSGNQITSFGTSIVGLKNVLDIQINPATKEKQDDILIELEKKADLTETQPVQEQNPITGFATSAKQLADGHNVAVSNMIPAIETGLATEAKQDDVITELEILNSLVPSKYDYFSLSYTGSNLTGVVFKTGGSGGTTVSTLVLAYDGSDNLTSVTKS